MIELSLTLYLKILKFKKFEQEISKEVLATKAEISENELDFVQVVKVEGSEVKISLKKA